MQVEEGSHNLIIDDGTNFDISCKLPNNLFYELRRNSEDGTLTFQSINERIGKAAIKRKYLMDVVLRI